MTTKSLSRDLRAALEESVSLARADRPGVPDLTLQAVVLGLCVAFAHKASGRNDVQPDNDVYWHTREACGSIAALSCGTAKFVRAVCNTFLTGSEDASLFRVCVPLWPHVVHPEILVREVIES